MALPSNYLSGFAGYCHWHMSHRQFPVDEFINKYKGMNLTWWTTFGDLPGLPANPCYNTPAEFEFMHRRVRRLSNAGFTTIIHIENKHFQFPSDPDYYLRFTGRLTGAQMERIERVVAATENFSVLYSPCLESHPMMFDWLVEAHDYIQSCTDRPTVHADSYRDALGVPNADLYDYDASRPVAHFANTDHEGPVLGYGKPSTQAAWVASRPKDEGVLVVTEMGFGDTHWPLYGWESKPIRWDNSQVHSALLDRVYGITPPPPDDEAEKDRLRKIIHKARRDLAGVGVDIQALGIDNLISGPGSVRYLLAEQMGLLR